MALIPRGLWPPVPPPFFDAEWYRGANADVAASGASPWRHWLRHGRAEGRAPARLDALLHEADLWRGSGSVSGAAERLAALAAGPSAAERILACWALARWRASRGEWEEAAALLRRLRAERGWRRLVPGAGPGPALLAARAFARAGAEAERRAALRDLPRSPDRRIVAADGAGPEAMVAALSAALARARLERPTLVPGPEAPLDRLRARPRRLRDGPLVTVIVPARDAEATLPTALGSLLAQSWTALEILVVENGSRDRTVAVAEAWARRDPRVRVLRSDEVGTYPARNLALAEARGRFVTVHDADDWSHPRKIEFQVAPMLRRRPPVATASHWLRLTPGLGLSVWRQEGTIVHRNTSSLLFSTALRDAVGYWDRVRVGADTEFQYRLLARFGPGAVEEVRPGLPLALGRAAPGSLTQRAGTHLSTQLGGVRRSYFDAARRWHARTSADALRLPRRPARRPFDVPAALGLGDPAAPLTPDDRLRRSPLLDPRWYLDAHEDVRRADLDPALHYLEAGAGAGLDPGPGFSTSGWRAARGLGEENPLLHYEEHGRRAGADPLPRIAGRIPSGRPRVVVFGHQGEAAVFGAERSLLDMLGRLDAEGLSPVAVLPRSLSDAYRDAVLARSEALHVVPYGWWREGREAHPVTVAALRRVLAGERAVEAHVNTLVIDAPLLAARAEGVSSVVHVREMPPGDPAICTALGAPAEAIRARMLARADRFVANSEMVAEWIDAPDRVVVRGNAVDPALFDLPLAPSRPLRVALVSSNLAKKGIADAVAIARRLGRAVEVRLIGPNSADLDALAPLPANVVHAGYAEEPVAAMAQAEIVLSLSRFPESFGRTVLEAMAAGRPVVAYDGGHPARLVAEGETGFVVPRGDDGAAAEAVRRLARDPELVRAMGRAGRARARSLLARTAGPISSVRRVPETAAG